MRPTSLLFAATLLAAPLAAQNLSPVQALPQDGPSELAAGAQRDVRLAPGGPGALAVWTDTRATLAGDGQSGEDVYAALLGADGAPVGAASFPLVVDMGYQREPLVAWNGSVWLVAWKDQLPTQFFFGEGVRAVRVAADGTLLDPTPIAVFPGGNSSGIEFGLTSNGDEFLVVKRGNSSGDTDIVGRRIDGQGGLLDPAPVLIHQGGTQLTFSLAAGSAGGEYLVHWTQGSGITARRLSAGLVPMGSFALPSGELGSNGTQYLVRLPGSGGQERFSRMTPTGSLLDPAGIPFAPSSPAVQGVRFAWDGTTWWLGWEDPIDGLHAARATATGQVLDFGGVELDPQLEDEQSGLALAGVPGGGAIAAWTDRRQPGADADDVRARGLSAMAQVGPEHGVSLAPPAQLHPDLTAVPGGHVIVYESRVSGEQRILARRLDQYGQALDPAPTLIGSGLSHSRPAVAWDGSRLLVAWSDGVNVLVRRLDASLDALDAAPLAAMEGITPDVEALGEDFLVVGTDFTTTIHFRFAFGVRVDGAGGAVLDAAPILLSTSFALEPRVTALGGRWLVAWERHFSHDDPQAQMEFAFVDAAGSNTLPTSIQAFGGHADVAASDTTALFTFRRFALPSANTDVGSMRLAADGSFVDPAGGAILFAGAGRQLHPAATWTGASFLVAWSDTRDQQAFYDERGDVYAARRLEDGSLVDAQSFPVFDSPRPEATPAVATSGTRSLLAASRLQGAAGGASWNLVLRTMTECTPPLAYCTAKANSVGGEALLGSTGSPSLTANDLVLTLGGGVPLQPAQVFHGSGGPAAFPFLGGTRCVALPLVRESIVTLDGSGSGQFSVPVVPSMVGTTRWYQVWYRDPAQADGTGVGLSDGLEVTFCE